MPALTPLPGEFPALNFLISDLCVYVSHSVVSNFLQPHGLQPRQSPLSMEFSRQKYWSGLPFPSPGNLSGPGIKPRCSALQADSLPSEQPGKKGSPHMFNMHLNFVTFYPGFFCVLYWCGFSSYLVSQMPEMEISLQVLLCIQWLSCVQLFATRWTVACQAPLQ